MLDKTVAALPNATWNTLGFVGLNGVPIAPYFGPIAIASDAASGDNMGMAALAFKAVTTPDTPANAGNFRPLRVEAPPGCVMHALPPSPTFTLWTGILAVEIITKALAKGMPDRLPASSGGDIFSMMGMGANPRTGLPWLEATNEAVGFGAHAAGDGENGIMHMSEPGCRNNPVEVLETKAPLLIEQYGYRVDSGGAGKHRGGVGVARTYRFLANSSALTLVKKTKTDPWGMAGGRDGVRGQVVLRPGTEQEAHVGGVYESMAAGEVLVNQSGGGGGWGDPLARDHAAVLDDVRNGYVSVEGAYRDYGVVVEA